MSKRIITLILSVLMVISLIPAVAFTAYADEADTDTRPVEEIEQIEETEGSETDEESGLIDEPEFTEGIDTIYEPENTEEFFPIDEPEPTVPDESFDEPEPTEAPDTLEPASAPVEPLEETYSGRCGKYMYWSLDTSTGELSITGTGIMTGYSSSSNASWYSYWSYLKSVIVSNGVTRIGTSAFRYCRNIKNITIESRVDSIGSSAFYYCTSLTNINIPDSVISILRFAKGVYANQNEFKTAAGCKTFDARFFTGPAASFAVLDAVNGETITYTAQVKFANGYETFITFDVH